MKQVQKFASVFAFSLFAFSASISAHAALRGDESNLDAAFARYCLAEKQECENNIEASSDDVVEMMMGYCARGYDRCLLELQRH